jgi:hypothetical protein
LHVGPFSRRAFRRRQWRMRLWIPPQASCAV